MPTVTATKQGFIGGVLRQPGETFEVPDGVKGSWLLPVPDDAPAQKKVKGKAHADDQKQTDDLV